MLQRILGIVGWVGTALVFGAVAIRFVRPEWDQYAVYAAWAGLSCVALYTAGQWRQILEFFRRRQARYGALATISVFVALAIAVAVNYLSARQNKRWDLTANQQYSLSEQTVRVLESLEGPVKFTVFDRQTEFDRFRPRLDEYAYHSNQVSVEYVDPDTRPVVAREYDIQAYGTVVVDYMGRREHVTSDMEQDLTNALIKAITGMERSVYFLQGHGEKDPTRTERDGYSAVADALRRDNYTVESLVLAQQKDVPADATVVVLAGPTSDVLPEEADALRRYLARAGKLMVLVDPAVTARAAPLPNIEALVGEWGIQVGNNVVVDVSGATNEPSIAVAASYPTHAITDRFATLTIYPLARSIDPVTSGVTGRFAQTLVETSPRSWAETNLATLTGDSGVEMEVERGDKAGPISIAAAVSAPAESPSTPVNEGDAPQPDAPKPETRVVVFGDSDFATNAYGGVPGNPNLFANAVSWLAQQENLIAIRPKQADDRRVTMTARQLQLVVLTSILVVPALVFAAGVFTWWRRR
ncbi:MAG: GldG family protein [Acidobacteria bacterium]|nr:GldG family protein [Acidobacteriota bacterium]